ncbi:MAG: tyrosine-type recombinase/integrase [Acidimicrobiales bacterium]
MRQTVRVFGIQDRRGSARVARPWVVRWEVDGKRTSRSFKTKALADRYRSNLMVASDRSEPFDRATGEPLAWAPNADDATVFEWSRRWLAEQWPEWQPRTRASAVEALARFVSLAVLDGAPSPPDDLRAFATRALAPDGRAGVADPCSRWLTRFSRPLNTLTRENLAEVDAALGVGVDGSPLAPSTAGRFRKVSRACVRRAVDLGILQADPWPPPARGRTQRKSSRAVAAFDVRTLPGPATMARALAAIRTHQPASQTYQVMTAVAYYAGLRPSEVVMLRSSALDLPESGWGRIDVNEADISFDESGEPKTGRRSVPIPPVLVEMLQSWIDSGDFEGEQLIFRTRRGNRPTASNWSRAWHRALRSIDQPTLRVYDCRHAAATTWLAAGVPLGEVAKRLGHSVETLVTTYVGAIEGDERLANDRIDAALGATSIPAQPRGDAS